MNFVQPIRDPAKIEAIKSYLKKENDRDYILFLVGIYTGFRISDILKIKVKDVKGLHISVKENKTDKSKKVRIHPELRRELNSYISNKDDDEYLFKSRNGDNKPITRSMAYKILKRAANHVKLDEIGTHTLRKTFGYHYYQQTKNVVTLQELFNHSSEKITLRYIGVNQDWLDQAILKMKAF